MSSYLIEGSKLFRDRYCREGVKNKEKNISMKFHLGICIVGKLLSKTKNAETIGNKRNNDTFKGEI